MDRQQRSLAVTSKFYSSESFQSKHFHLKNVYLISSLESCGVDSCNVSLKHIWVDFRINYRRGPAYSEQMYVI